MVSPQIALISLTLISLTLVQSADIRRIGEIPVGLSPLQLPTCSPGHLALMLVDGVMLGCIDTLLTAVVSDRLTRTEHKSNKELIG